MREQFLLADDIVFLNHGSFGAVPRPVMEALWHWQKEVEKDPVLFNVWRWVEELEKVRHRLASYVGTEPGNLAFIENSTFGANTVANSLPLGKGDQVIITDWEYGACVRAWQYYSEQKGFDIHTVQMPSTFETDEQLLAPIIEAVSNRTKVIFISHIFSPTGIIFPVKKLTSFARERGILTVIDGAHAPGQIDINLEELGADFYFGNCHKWMLSARGAAFLYVRKEYQDLIKPPIISWGTDWENPHPVRFIALVEMQGTRDYTPFLTVGNALDFLNKNNWTDVRRRAKELIRYFGQGMQDLFGLKPLTHNLDFFGQMYAYPLPEGTDREELYKFLYLKNKIQVPLTKVNGRLFIRASFQAYNVQKDYEALLIALQKYYEL